MRPLTDPWNRAVTGYTTALLAAGRSPGTIRLHRHYLHRLPEVATNPAQVTTGDLERLLAVPGWSPETRKSARTALRGFFRWATRAGIVDTDPAAELATVRIPPAAPRPAPEDVIAAALAGADRRLRGMIMLAAYAGLRCAEVAQVHTDDLTGDSLRVHGKGGKIRDVPLTADTLAALVELLPPEPGYVFPGPAGHLTPGHVSRLLSRALPPGWTGHTLRHRMATTAYAGTRDLLAVGAVLGHSRPETTQRYVKMPDDAIRAALQAAAPRHLYAVPDPDREPYTGTVPPCPDWCDLPPGHEYDDELYAGAGFTRLHLRTFGSGAAAVVVGTVENAITPSGPVDPDPEPPALSTTDVAELTPTQARDMARNLRDAAELVERIT